MDITELIQIIGSSGINVLLAWLFLQERNRSKELSDDRVDLLRDCYSDLLREQVRANNKKSDPPALPR